MVHGVEFRIESLYDVYAPITYKLGPYFKAIFFSLYSPFPLFNSRDTCLLTQECFCWRRRGRKGARETRELSCQKIGCS